MARTLPRAAVIAEIRGHVNAPVPIEKIARIGGDGHDRIRVATGTVRMHEVRLRDNPSGRDARFEDPRPEDIEASDPALGWLPPLVEGRPDLLVVGRNPRILSVHVPRGSQRDRSVIGRRRLCRIRSVERVTQRGARQSGRDGQLHRDRGSENATGLGNRRHRQGLGRQPHRGVGRALSGHRVKKECTGKLGGSPAQRTANATRRPDGQGGKLINHRRAVGCR